MTPPDPKKAPMALPFRTFCRLAIRKTLGCRETRAILLIPSHAAVDLCRMKNEVRGYDAPHTSARYRP